LLCDRHESTTFSFTAVFKNGDSHLSKNDIPYPYVYTVFVCLWVVFFIIWLINWIYTRHITKLHLTISSFVVTKIATVVFFMAYWIVLNNVGFVSDTVTIFFYVFKIIVIVAFYTVLLLIGVGWGMTDDKPPRHWPLLLVLIVLYGTFYGLSLFFYLFGIASIVLLCVTLYTVYWAAAASCLILAERSTKIKQEIEAAEKGDENPDSGTNIALLKSELEHAQLQSEMLKRFCYIMMSYVIGRVIESFIVLFVSLDWVDALLSEVLDIALFICIGWVFRLHSLKKNGMYYVLENEFEEYGVSMSEIGSNDEAASAPNETVANETVANEAVAEVVVDDDKPVQE